MSGPAGNLCTLVLAWHVCPADYGSLDGEAKNVLSAMFSEMKLAHTKASETAAATLCWAALWPAPGRAAASGNGTPPPTCYPVQRHVRQVVCGSCPCSIHLGGQSCMLSELQQPAGSCGGPLIDCPPEAARQLLRAALHMDCCDANMLSSGLQSLRGMASVSAFAVIGAVRNG